MIALDASALVALLRDEPGQEIVADHIAEAAISAVNLAEVLARLSRVGVAPHDLLPRLASLGMTVVEFDAPQALVVASLREAARSRGLGLADCCCLALARHCGWPVLTADRVWTTLGLDLDIRLIR